MTSGEIIIPKDKFQEFVEFSKEMGRRKIKEIGCSSKGGICEVTFGYHSKMGGYTTSMSDIPKLYERASQDKEKSI